MLYTIIDLYEVLRTDEIYPEKYEPEDKSVGVCTNPYDYLKNTDFGGLLWKL